MSDLLDVASHLSLDGGRATERMRVDSAEITIYRDGRAAPAVTLSMSEVAEFRTRLVVGSGFLQAKVEGVWVDLLRYARQESSRFARIRKCLEALRVGDELPAFDEDSERPRCRACRAELPYKDALCPDCGKRSAVVRRLFMLVYPFRYLAATLAALLLLGVAVSLIPPKLQQYLIDDVLQAGKTDAAATDTLIRVVVALGAVRAFTALSTVLKSVVSLHLGNRLTASLREKMVAKLHALPMAFYDDNQVPMLSTRVTGDTQALQGFVNQLTHGILGRILQFVAAGVVLFWMSWKLALYTLLPAPIMIAGSYLYAKYVYPKHFRSADSVSRQAAALAGMLYGIRVVKAFAQEDREVFRFKGASDYVTETRLDVGMSSSAYGNSMWLVFSLGSLLVWYVGGRDVLAGEMTLGSLMAFFGYLSMFYAPLTSLAQLTTWISSFSASCVRVFEILDTPEDIVDPEDARALPADVGHVRFEDVTFGYDRHSPVLSDLSFEISKGEMVGIVGTSGSGKTTLVSLLCRFYDVQEGRISIDGVDLRDVSRAELRRRVGVVLQDTFLFRGSIRDNLTYGAEDATVHQILRAAKAAQAHEFILRLPFGYDSFLSERGSNLSGGERQRLAIARAVLYDPPILLLDEATSNLDTQSERAVQDALEAITRGRTVLAIAHRLSTLRHANRILVFEKGRLVEDGSHEALLSQDGVYAKLVKLQARVSADTPVDELKRSAPDPDESQDRSNCDPVWLPPSSTRVVAGPHETFDLETDGARHSGVEAVLAFHTQRDRYICIRSVAGTGATAELGVIDDLRAFDAGTQRAVRRMLERHYHLPVIESIEHVESAVGMLTFDVTTQYGPQTFTMRSARNRAGDYGTRGKVLIDVAENRYLIPDVERLAPLHRWRLRRYIYW